MYLTLLQRWGNRGTDLLSFSPCPRWHSCSAGSVDFLVQAWSWSPQRFASKFSSWFVFRWPAHLQATPTLINVSLDESLHVRGLEGWSCLLSCLSDWSQKKSPLPVCLRQRTVLDESHTVLCFDITEFTICVPVGSETSLSRSEFSACLQTLFPLVHQICTHREGIMVGC